MLHNRTRKSLGEYYERIVRTIRETKVKLIQKSWLVNIGFYFFYFYFALYFFFGVVSWLKADHKCLIYR